MRKKIGLWIGLGLMTALSGCATTGPTKTAQSDIDALNARLSSLQGELSEKDAEIAKLQNRMRDEESARSQAEAEKRALADRLEATLADLKAAKAAPKRPDSDLK